MTLIIMARLMEENIKREWDDTGKTCWEADTFFKCVVLECFLHGTLPIELLLRVPKLYIFSI